MKDAAVLFPSLGKGHLMPMVELAKLFARQDLSVTIILVEPPFPALSPSDSFISRLSSAHPLISFHRLPTPDPQSSDPISIFFEFFRRCNPSLSDFLQTLSQTHAVRALVLDMFCTGALDVAADLRVTAYFFFCSAASSLATFLFVPSTMQLNGGLKDLGDQPLDIPGLPPIPASHIPDTPRNPEEEARRKGVISPFERLLEAKGIIVNTFEELERRAVEALVNGLCVPGRDMPPIYCVGPLVAEAREEDEEIRHECLKWLDKQPKESVVFLCFGSMGSFSAEQLKEIAVGLERSGQRFLWVVRSPPSDDFTKWFERRSEPDLRLLMPEGFLETTRERGMVVKSWAPQAAVLGHGSVGGFVSHCGWNSILEAVAAGVPVIAWPLFAEQKINKVFLVEEARVAVGMERDESVGLVSAEEVETKVRWLMESEGGRALRDRAAATKERAALAWKDGGSSAKAWSELMNAMQSQLVTN